MANWGLSRDAGVPMERFKQNHLAIPGRYHPIEAILMNRKQEASRPGSSATDLIYYGKIIKTLNLSLTLKTQLLNPSLCF